MTIAETAPRVQAAPSSQRQLLRPDIQGLRALAVLVVIAYHLRPTFFSGGFVGVDVFFVISGYLIVGSLAKEAVRTGRVRMTAFYARRVRRLMPASTIVILTTLGLGLVILPATQWRELGIGAIASSLQVQNWLLAFGPNEYAQATAAVSPYQHFWSLAVEEQFYAVVPLVVLLTALLAVKRARSVHRALGVVLASALVISLGWSIVYTSLDPQAAYFATTSRIWQLAVGGLLALAAARVRPGSRAATALAFTGLVAIIATTFTFSTAMPFPGWIALIPTLGTAALLLAGQSEESTLVTRVLGWRPVTYIGDISYSLYLWHWPVIVFSLALLQLDALPWPWALVALAVSLLLAAASERFIERPFRGLRPRRSERTFRRGTLAVGAGLVTIGVVAGAAPVMYIDNRLATPIVASAEAHPGAMVFRGTTVDDTQLIAPDPLLAAADIPLANRDSCILTDITLPDPPDGLCHYGPADALQSVVLVGDSHAAVLSTPLADLAEGGQFRLTVMVRNGCPFNIVPMAGGFEDCAAQNQRSLDLILREKPDQVIVANLSADGYQRALGWAWPSPEAAIDGFVSTLRPIAEAGIGILAVRDTPYPPFAPPDCVIRHGDSEACGFAPPAASADPLLLAAAQVAGARVVDLTDAICEPELCRSVEGNVLVYRDNHLSDTYARTLSPWLAEALAG